MKLNPISINFGKQKVAICKVKTNEKEERYATIFEYDPEDTNDVTSLKKTALKKPIERQHYSNYPHAFQFYAICDNKTGEIIACTQLSQHYSPAGEHKGFYTKIDNLQTNPDYISATIPMFGFIAHKAQEKSSKNIITDWRTCKVNNLKGLDIKETETDSEIYALPANKFQKRIEKAENINNLQIIV